jgi:predicted HicB family RNase H-like nuclease
MKKGLDALREKRNKMFTMRILPSVKTKLEEMAIKDHVKMAELIEQLIISEYEARNKKR